MMKWPCPRRPYPLPSHGDAAIVLVVTRILYITAVGPSDPTRASLALHLAANGAAEAGYEADIVLAADAAELIKPGVADSVTGLGIPPFAELLAKAQDKGIALHV